MTNRDRLKQLMINVFLLNPAEFHFDLAAGDVDTWDSLGVVSLAVGLHETFGYHCTPEEAVAIRSVPDIIRLLGSKGVSFDA